MTKSQKRLGLLFIMVGPPGVGKNTIMEKALETFADLHQLPTATTRAIRDNEQQGREHLFVSEPEFQTMIDNDQLIEWQVVHGKLYGVPRATVELSITTGQDLIADIEVFGATLLRSLYPDNAVLIFVSPPSIDDLRSRMEDRGEPQAEIENRMKRVALEMPFATACDYYIVNDDLDEAIETAGGIIRAERSHRDLLNLRVERGKPRSRMDFATTVIPMYGDEILVPASPSQSLTGNFEHGELPYDAALRLLRDNLNIDALFTHLADGITPLTVQIIEQPHFSQITFFYIHNLQERINVQGFQWVRRDAAALSEAIADALPIYSPPGS